MTLGHTFLLETPKPADRFSPCHEICMHFSGSQTFRIFYCWARWVFLVKLFTALGAGACKIIFGNTCTGYIWYITYIQIRITVGTPWKRVFNHVVCEKAKYLLCLYIFMSVCADAWMGYVVSLSTVKYKANEWQCDSPGMCWCGWCVCELETNFKCTVMMARSP